jgi:hypothetical protein
MAGAANVGDWTLSLFEQTLIVDQPTSGRGGNYFVGAELLPPSAWKTLVGRDGAKLPVAISRQPDGSLGVYLLSEPAPWLILPPIPGS